MNRQVLFELNREVMVLSFSRPDMHARLSPFPTLRRERWRQGHYQECKAILQYLQTSHHTIIYIYVGVGVYVYVYISILHPSSSPVNQEASPWSSTTEPSLPQKWVSPESNQSSITGIEIAARRALEAAAHHL